MKATGAGRRGVPAANKLRVGIVVAIGATVGLASGTAIVYLLPHPRSTEPLQVILNGTTYDVLNESWTQASPHLACYPGVAAGAMSSEATLAWLPWRGAIFQIVILPESCGFPFNGSFLFSVNVTTSVVDPEFGVVPYVSSGYLAFATRGASSWSNAWSNLTLFLDGGHFGVMYFPEYQILAPELQGVPPIAFSFWLLSDGSSVV